MKGPIAWFAKNPVAANLLMVLIVVGGILGVSRTKMERPRQTERSSSA